MKSLRDYQIADLAFYIRERRCANLSDPGTGKTPSVCVYMYWLWREKSKRSFWVMPKSLLKKNRRELLDFSSFTEDDVVIYDGTPAQRKQILEGSDAKVWLMGFRRYADEWPALTDRHPDFDALIVDEVHMGFGGAESGQTEQMWQSMKRLERFLVMTGTLINGKLDSAYPTIKVIEPRYYATHQSFLNIHEMKDIYGARFGWKNHGRLGRILSKHAIRRSFESVYGVNEVVTNVELVEMSAKQRKIYDEFEQAAMLDLGDRFLTSDGVAVVQVARLRQIMAHPENVSLPVSWDKHGEPTAFKIYNLLGKGAVTGKDGRLVVHLADHRNTGEPLLIYAALQKEIDRIAELCRKEGFRVGKIHGGVSAKERGRIDEAFQAGEIDIVVASPQTAAVGFNWGHVDHIVFVSLDYMDSNYMQARRRAERGVRTKPLRVTVLEYENSIDQKIFAIVQRKSEDAVKVDATQAKVELGAQAHCSSSKPIPATQPGKPSSNSSPASSDRPRPSEQAARPPAVEARLLQDSQAERHLSSMATGSGASISGPIETPSEGEAVRRRRTAQTATSILNALLAGRKS